MALGPLVVGVNADASGFAGSAAQGIAASEPQMKVAGLTSGVAIGTAIGQGIVSAVSGAVDLIKGTISGFAELVSSGIDISSELMATQLQTGVAASSLLSLKEAAASTGTSFDDLVDGIRETNLKLGEALNGEQSAIDAFTNIGLSVEQLRGTAPDQLFALVTDKLRGMEDGAMRVASAAKIMGDDVGVKMPQYLAQGGDAAANLAARWIELGAIIDQSDLAGASGLSTRLGVMEQTFDRFKILLAGEVAPYIQYALTLMDNLVVSTGGLGPTAAKAAEGFGVVAGYAIDAGQVIYGIGEILWGVAKAITGIGEYATAGFAVMIGAAEYGAGKATEAVSGFLADTAQNMREIGDNITTFFNGVVDSVTGAIVDAMNFLIDGWNAVAETLGLGTLDRLQGVQARAAVNTAPGMIETTLREFQAFGKQTAQAGMDLMQSASDQLQASTTFEDAWKNITKGADNFMQVFDDGADRWSNTFKQGVSDAAAATAQEFSKAATATTNAAVSKGGSYAMPAYGAYSNFNAPQYSNMGGLSTPTGAYNNIAPASSYGPPINSTINVASGVDAQQVKQAVKEAQKQVINTIQTKNAAGGTFRNNLQC
jgi:hypothetical protein